MASTLTLGTHRLAIAAVTRGRFFSTSAGRAGKVYELRRYAVHPSKMRECMAVLEEVLAMRAKFSKMNGCWSTELGGLNELHFLWEFDDLSHRTTVRKELAMNKEWVSECLPKVLPLFDTQTNLLLKPLQWYEPKLDPVKGYGVYELVQHEVKPGLLPQFEHLIQQGFPARLRYDYPHPIGMWYSEFGPSQNVFTITPHVNLEEREKHRTVLMNDTEWKETQREAMKLMNGVTVKAIVPAPFSPIQ